ncbi:hypothetical protein N7494_004537 [Penicillium frequentans]|uniref:Zn(2)-C6 fungal-type domain-containing protein n=1 Tax=Penicillium frequentans TaxID=3151616 RepID=A0AAD6D0U6_9EURO|nr:hypothetical protein N7494_004537 [Penicillium glabrum]
MPSPPADDSPKLRGSCQACAVSKVRCSKEKPTCARCRRRSTTCEYFITKRPGRKQQEKASAPVPTNTTPHLLPELDCPATRTLPDQQPPSVQDDTSPSDSDTFSNLFHQTDTSLSSAITTWSTEFDDYLAPFSICESVALDALDPGPLDPTVGQQMDSSRSSVSGSNSAMPPEDTISLFGRPVPMPSSKVLFPTDTRNQDRQQSPSFNSPCSCLPRALDLLKQLAATDLIAGVQTDQSHSKGAAQSLDATIATNQQTMETLEGILQCSCSQDSYLLAIVSLIIFKSFDRYAAAASAKKRQAQSQRLTLSSVGVDGDFMGEDDLDSHMAAAQRVLGELHRVQQCMARLSPRLQACGSTASALSDVVMGQLEPELQRRLGILSMSTIQTLRTEQ